tara:strand:- start:748 stop:1155 length:408 start_codon:yes stop_codon:yes gene_type:complete
MSQVTVEELQNFVDGVPYVHDLGLRIVRVEEGVCQAHLPYQARFAQYYNLIHGGVTASLADTMLYMAHATLNGITTDTVTTNLNVTYLQAATEEPLNAEARVMKNGRKLIYGEVLITNETGALIAHAAVTYLRLK